MGPVTLLADVAPGAKRAVSYTQIPRNVAIAELRVAPTSFGQAIPYEAAPSSIDEDETQALVCKRLPALDLQQLVLRLTGEQS